ncbi:hypothetical protein SAMN02983003_2592 [Devosia enhydra]|uniref:SH3 domain-containing protein n=1 Tax=Devosia enhydra TaxID=665118 RepID=A0A1K2HZR6_9HYPH|nr:hypothetical protein [Devosia enhydra]SFZ85427.1 hypothetical protein SAMN02983003_2592 [Devosia enhydra]
MRITVSAVLASLAIGSLPLCAHAGEPYSPIPLQPAQAIEPPADLLRDAAAFLDAVQKDDRAAIAAGLSADLTLVDGALELGIPRRTETIGPFETVEQALVALADNIGGIYERPFDGSDITPFAIKAEREFIALSLTETVPWGRDPLLADAFCTYGYRSFDTKAVSELGERLDTQTSSFFYLDAPTDILARPEPGAPVVATLAPDLLYGLDYDTDAPSHWIAVHLPDGGSGFIDFDRVELNKPYATGICFSRSSEGRWVMSAQTATNL